MGPKSDSRNQPHFDEPYPIKSTFIVQLSNLFEKYILVRPSISPQYTWRISVSGVQENWRIGVKIWKGLVLWSGLMGTFFFGGILFLRMVFFGSKFRSAKLRIRLLSTSLNSPRSQARQASARFCIFAHYLALRRGREWIFQSSKSVDWALNSNQCYQCYQCMCPLCLWGFSNVLNVNKVLFVGALRLCEFEFGLFRICVINVVVAQKYVFSVWGAGSCWLGKIPTFNDIYFIINQGWTFFSTYVLRWTGDVRKGKWSPKFDKANTNISLLLLRFWDEWSTD